MITTVCIGKDKGNDDVRRDKQMVGGPENKDGQKQKIMNKFCFSFLDLFFLSKYQLLDYFP